MGGGGGGSNSASIILDLEEGAEVDSLVTTIEALIPASGLGGSVAEQSDSASFGGTALAINVTGPSFADVEAGSAIVQEALGSIAGISELRSNILGERPEIIVAVDQTAASQAGLYAAALAGAVRAYLTPIPVTSIEIDGTQTSVIVETEPDAIASPEALALLPLGPGLVLGDVAAIT